jgi:PEP-CTERM motif
MLGRALVGAALVTASLLSATGLRAASFDLPAPLSSQVQALEVEVKDRGSFCNTINFTVGDSSNATFSTNLTSGRLAGDGFLIGVYNGANQLLSSASNLVNLSLNPGSYYASVHGFFKSKGGEYNFSALAAPVPLPAALWLLGGGVAGFWFVARRK